MRGFKIHGPYCWPIVIPEATGSSAGVMGAADKVGLDACVLPFDCDYYLDTLQGDDTNPGTQAKPWKTLEYALRLVGPAKKLGKSRLHLAPGNYDLPKGAVYDIGPGVEPLSIWGGHDVLGTFHFASGLGTNNVTIVEGGLTPHAFKGCFLRDGANAEYAQILDNDGTTFFCKEFYPTLFSYETVGTTIEVLRPNVTIGCADRFDNSGFSRTVFRGTTPAMDMVPGNAKGFSFAFEQAFLGFGCDPQGSAIEFYGVRIQERSDFNTQDSQGHTDSLVLIFQGLAVHVWQSWFATTRRIWSNRLQQYPAVQVEFHNALVYFAPSFRQLDIVDFWGNDLTGAYWGGEGWWGTLFTGAQCVVRGFLYYDGDANGNGGAGDGGGSQIYIDQGCRFYVPCPNLKRTQLHVVESYVDCGDDGGAAPGELHSGFLNRTAVVLWHSVGIFDNSNIHDSNHGISCHRASQFLTNVNNGSQPRALTSSNLQGYGVNLASGSQLHQHSAPSPANSLTGALGTINVNGLIKNWNDVVAGAVFNAGCLADYDPTTDWNSHG